MTFRKAVLGSDYGDLIFTSREHAGPLESWLLDLKGWYGGVGVTEGGPQRALGHGAFPQRARRTERTITLEGMIHVIDDTDRDTADRIVSAALWEGGFWPLTVTHGDLTLTTQVQLDGDIGHTYVGERALKVQFPLRAPDPFLYGQRQETTLALPGMGRGFRWSPGPWSGGYARWGAGAAPARMTNDGHAEAWPTFRVTGDFPEGFRLSVGGRVVEYPGIVTARSPVDVDYGSGQVLTGGRDVTHMLVSRQWEPIPPRSAITPKLTARSKFSEGWATGAWADTYI